MVDKDDSTETQRETKTLPGTVDVRRRRLLVGSASAPVLLSIASRPAWGSACSPSALASANASGRHDYAVCANKSAGYWKMTSRWPDSVSPDMKFSAAFGNGVFGDLTLGQVINLTGSQNQQYGFSGQAGLHIVGAYVNSFAFPYGSSEDFGYTTAQIVQIFNAGMVPPELEAPGFIGTPYDVVAFFEYINNRDFF